MVPTEFRVWREVDNRAKDGHFVDAQQDEITALRREVRRLKQELLDTVDRHLLAELTR